MKNAPIFHSREQRGFSLLELSVTLAIMASVIVWVITLQIDQARVDKLRAVAQTYQRLNTAAGNYLSVYYQQLTQLKPECSIPTWTTNYPADASAVPNARSDCGLVLALNGRPGVAIANGLQPTLDELAALSLLDRASAANGLPLSSVTAAKSHLAAVTSGNWLVGTRAGVLSPQFMVLIEFICINGVGRFTQTGSCVDPTTQRDGAFDLRSLVFNSQPFDLDRSGGQTLLTKLLEIAGADTFLSTRRTGDANDLDATQTDNGELRALSGAAEAMLRNPVRHVPTDSGAPNIVAMRNGFGAAGWDRFVRRDGSTPMTGNWNSDLTLGTLDPNTGTGSSQLTVNGNSTFNGSTTFNRPSQFNQGITSNSGVFGTLSQPGAFTAALKASSAYIEDLIARTLRVTNTALFEGLATFNGGLTTAAGSSATFNGNLSTASSATATFNGPAQFNNKSSFFQFKLEKEANLNAGCNPNDETLARAATTSAKYASPDNLRLLVCDRQTNTWIASGPDYQNQISNINTNITNINNTLTLKLNVIDEFHVPNIGSYVATPFKCADYYRPMLSGTYGTTDSGFTFRTTSSCGPNDLWYVYMWNNDTIFNRDSGAVFSFIKKNVGISVSEYETQGVGSSSGLLASSMNCNDYHAPAMSHINDVLDDRGFSFSSVCFGTTWATLLTRESGSGTFGAVLSFIRKSANLVVLEFQVNNRNSFTKTNYSCTEYYRPIFNKVEGISSTGFLAETLCSDNVWQVKLYDSKGSSTGFAQFLVIKR